jgi:hypothetical protein
MADWLPLREHLRRTIAAQLDHAVLHDPELHALLTQHRERTLARLTDQAELMVLREITCERVTRDFASLASINGHLAKVNGRA